MQIPGSSDRLVVEHHLLNNPQLRMAKAVQEWLQTIKLDERYQTDMKIAMAKLEPKRIYWFEQSHFNQFVLLSIFSGEKTCHYLKSSYNTNLLNPYVICLVNISHGKRWGSIEFTFLGFRCNT